MASTTETLRLGPADHGRRMTLEEFLDADAIEGNRCELARGFVEVTEAPDQAHNRVVRAILPRLLAHHHSHPGLIGRASGPGEQRLLLPRAVSVRSPDVAVVLEGMSKNPRGQRPPSLVMEVVSPGAEARRRDYETKREEYLAFGLREYWIVDPIERRVLALIRDGDAWVERPFAEGQHAEGLVLPGFRVAVTELLALPPDEGDGEGEAPGG